MAGMPNPKETSDSNGGAAQFFKQVEGWLNDPVRRQANRAQARTAVAGNLAGVPTGGDLTGPPVRTLAGNPGINHFNKHWRGRKFRVVAEHHEGEGRLPNGHRARGGARPGPRTGKRGT